MSIAACLAGFVDTKGIVSILNNSFEEPTDSTEGVSVGRSTGVPLAMSITLSFNPNCNAAALYSSTLYPSSETLFTFGITWFLSTNLLIAHCAKIMFSSVIGLFSIALISAAPIFGSVIPSLSLTINISSSLDMFISFKGL